MLSRLLQTFSVDQQRFGEFLEEGACGTCGCGSFRRSVREEYAKGVFYVFAQRLERALKRKSPSSASSSIATRVAETHLPHDTGTFS